MIFVEWEKLKMVFESVFTNVAIGVSATESLTNLHLGRLIPLYISQLAVPPLAVKVMKLPCANEGGDWTLIRFITLHKLSVAANSKNSAFLKFD